MSDSKKKFEAVKKQLLERKKKLEEQLSALSSESISDGQVQDQGDETFSSVMESLRSSLQNTEVEEHRRIVQALEMIEEGTYGVCIDCDESIRPKRLTLFPNAVRCLACQELFEEK